jgi:hypothetical protein
MKLPAANFCIWPRALPCCQRCRVSLGRKPIRRGRFGSSWDLLRAVAARLTGHRIVA